MLILISADRKDIYKKRIANKIKTRFVLLVYQINLIMEKKKKHFVS